MTLPDAILLFSAALAAGLLNSVAGGGTFLTFPALLFTGVPPISANATSTVAVWPGSVASARAYRDRMPKSLRLLAPLAAASLAGGFAGARVLLHTPPRTFLRVIPFLMLGATLLFAFGPRILRGAFGRDAHGASWRRVGTVAGLQFLTAFYGGYFGAGMGIVMLSFLTLLPLGDIHAMNSVKTLLNSVANGVAVLTFILARIIFWPQGVLMLCGAVLGGYGGAHYAQQLDPGRVRVFVVVVGFALSIVFFAKYK
jgi:uncharacterized protein